VVALKEFRDAHMIIATLYVLGPARRVAQITGEGTKPESGPYAELGDGKEPLKGTGGTNLVRFLKDTRNRTNEAIIP